MRESAPQGQKGGVARCQRARKAQQHSHAIACRLPHMRAHIAETLVIQTASLQLVHTKPQTGDRERAR